MPLTRSITHHSLNYFLTQPHSLTHSLTHTITPSLAHSLTPVVHELGGVKPSAGRRAEEALVVREEGLGRRRGRVGGGEGNIGRRVGEEEGMKVNRQEGTK